MKILGVGVDLVSNSKIRRLSHQSAAAIPEEVSTQAGRCNSGNKIGIQEAESLITSALRVGGKRGPQQGNQPAELLQRNPGRQGRRRSLFDCPRHSRCPHPKATKTSDCSSSYDFTFGALILSRERLHLYSTTSRTISVVDHIPSFV